MNDNYVQELRNFYNNENFNQLWLRIATDIKIRKFDNIEDIPEFHQLSKKLQDDIKTQLQSISNGYKKFTNEQHLNSSHVLLFINEKQKWIAMFQDNTPSVNMQALFGSIAVGGVLLTWNVLSSYANMGTSNNENSDQLIPTSSSQTTNTSDSATTNTISSYFGPLSSSLPVATYYGLKSWLSSRVSQYNQNIEACMLKKLEGIINSE